MRWGFCVFPSRLFVHTLSLGANPSGFRRLRTFWELWVLLPTGSSCARVAHWRVGVRTGARYSQAYFCLQLRNSRTNRNALVQTATLQPERRFSCELRIYSRIAACLLGRRIFRPAAAIPRERWCACGAVASAGLLGALDRDIGGGGGRRQFGLRLVCWPTVGQRRSRRQTYGWRVAAEELG